jgi:RNA polymerase sigma-70 factor (ECF subfamily)
MNRHTNSKDQDDAYSEAISQYGSALARLVVGYEANAERRRDLLQEIHIALWKSLANFHGHCSLRTWVYRIGHNVAISHVIKDKGQLNSQEVGLDELEEVVHSSDATDGIDASNTLERLLKMIRQLKALDQQIILLYLDDVDANTIGQITGMSSINVATKIHRIKQFLARNFHLSRQAQGTKS